MFNSLAIKLAKISLFLLISITLSSCAQTYENATSFDLGFTKVCTYGKSSAIITFRRHPFTSEALAVDFLLYKAAEVTVEQNMDYFEVISVNPAPLATIMQRKYSTYLLGKEKFYTFKDAEHFIRLYQGCNICRISFNSFFIAIKMHDEAPVAGPMSFNAQEIFGYFRTLVF